MKTKRLNLNREIEKAFSDFDGPYHVYRSVYKSVDCGPTIGFSFTVEDGNEQRLYNDDLHKLGTWEDWDKSGLEITGISVSSIVEGSDVEIDAIWVDTSGKKAKQIEKEFWTAVESVDKEAAFYWERDNSKWYSLQTPNDDWFPFHETWGEIKWDTDDKPPENIVKAVEKAVLDDRNYDRKKFNVPRCKGYVIHEIDMDMMTY